MLETNFNWLRQRTTKLELMDDFSIGGAELTEALRHLRLINRIFGASGPTLYGVRRLWEQMDKPKRLSILDVGAGSGDVNQRLLRWADQEQIDLTVTLVDITEEACKEAKHIFRNEPRIQVLQKDVFQLPEASADIVTSTQFLHHFTNEELSQVTSCMLKASRMGMVINDIHRHWVAWTAVWIVTRLISRNRYIQNDGPLSIAKGFRDEDWEQLKQTPGLETLSYYWRPLFRYAVIVSKEA